MKRRILAAVVTLALVAVTTVLFASTAPAAPPSYGMPAVPDPAAKYLFYHHNYYVESKGPDGDCKYRDILKAFSDRGYVVISEIRPKDASVIQYGKKGAADVRKLLAAGVPPRNITVAGHSKGGVITLQTAAELNNPDIRYLVMAGCGIKGLEKGYPDFSRLQGSFLSIYATSDKVAQSCKQAFAQAGGGTFSGKEIALESAAGHQLFFTPASVWLDPAAGWLEEGK